MTREVIDIVIPWVDGDDPVLAAKRRQYLTGKREDKHADVAAATRYCDLGEIFWCIDSINIFAPFIRKIFIVTDGQDPHLEDSGIERAFPSHERRFLPCRSGEA